MIRLTKFFWIMTFVLALTGASYAMQPFLSFGHPLEGQQAPDFTLRELNGSEVNFTKFRDGKPAVVFFWATWCPHCREQLEEMNSRHSELEQKGIKLVVIDIAEDSEVVRKYLSKRIISLQILMDHTGELAQTYSIIGVPTYFLINPQGTVKSMDHSLPPDYEKILKEE